MKVSQAKALLFIVGSLTCSLALAAPTPSPSPVPTPNPQSETRGDRPPSFLPGGHAVTVEENYYAPARADGRNGKINSSDTRIKFGERWIGPFIPTMADRFTFSTDFAYGYRYVSATSEYLLPQRHHNISVALSPRYALSDRWTAALMLIPSFSSTFVSAGPGFRLPILATATYSASSKWIWFFGVFFRINDKSLPLLPGAGFIYRPNLRWSIELMGPRLSANYRPVMPLKLSVGVEYAGSQYAVEEARYGAKTLVYREAMAVFSAEAMLSRHLKIHAGMGGAFLRRIKFYDTTRSDIVVHPGVVARAGLSYEW